MTFESSHKTTSKIAPEVLFEAASTTAAETAIEANATATAAAKAEAAVGTAVPETSPEATLASTTSQKAKVKPEKDEVDIIGMAYENARAEGVQLRTGGAGYLKVVAPAKVNLYLGVGPKQENGYHPVQNVMHTLLAHDVLYMRRLSAQAFAYETGVTLAQKTTDTHQGLEIHLTCSGAGAIEPPEVPAEKNIVYQAIQAFSQEFGKGAGEVADIHLEKHLPHQAGLGGGSSDAAAALVGAAKLWGIDPCDARIESVAKSLGADVAFFLRGGCALYNGAGENYVRSLKPRKDPAVLIKPEGGLSTAAVYKAFDKKPIFADEYLKNRLATAHAAEDVPLFNGLEDTADRLDNTLGSIRSWALSQPGVLNAMLTGSGSCTFVICANTQTAFTVSAAAQAQGWWATSTFFTNIRAAISR